MYSFGMGLVRPGCQAIRLQDYLTLLIHMSSYVRHFKIVCHAFHLNWKLTQFETCLNFSAFTITDFWDR